MRKNNLIRILLGLIGILIFQISFSQENFMAGYIVSLKGDTVSGFIDYRNWEKNPDQVLFKKRQNSHISKYKPSDINEFTVKDELYKSAVVKVGISSIKMDDLKYDPNVGLKTDTVFLQTLIKGLKSLYYYKSNLGVDHFYIREGQSFELLIYKKYLRSIDGNDIITENKKYVGQLKLFFNDGLSTGLKFANVKYSRKSLEKLFRSYYTLTNSSIEFQKTREKISTEIGILTGVTITSLFFDSYDHEYITGADYDKSINFTGGIFFDVIMPRKNKKWSICNELTFASYSIDGVYKEYENENKYSKTYTELGYSYVKLNNMVRYKYPIGNLYLYANVGISNGFAIKEKNFKRVESKFYSEEGVQDGKAFNTTRMHEQGCIFGVGGRYKTFSIELRSEIGNGMSPYTGMNSTTRRYYFLVGYRF